MKCPQLLKWQTSLQDAKIRLLVGSQKLPMIARGAAPVLVKLGARGTVKECVVIQLLAVGLVLEVAKILVGRIVLAVCLDKESMCIGSQERARNEN